MTPDPITAPIHDPEGIEEEHFLAQFPHEDQFAEASGDEARPNWWEAPR